MENMKSILDFQHNVALFLLQTPFENTEFGRDRSTTKIPSQFNIKKPLYRGHGHFIIKSEDSKRLCCKQCHSQAAYQSKVF